jgi:hypothetical protein
MYNKVSELSEYEIRKYIGDTDFITIPHSEGHCEHVGDCEIYTSFSDFILSEEGKKSFESLVEWIDRNRTEMERFYTEAFSRGFTPRDWIDSEEIETFRDSLSDDDIPSWWGDDWKENPDLWFF